MSKPDFEPSWRLGTEFQSRSRTPDWKNCNWTNGSRQKPLVKLRRLTLAYERYTKALEPLHRSNEMSGKGKSQQLLQKSFYS